MANNVLTFEQIDHVLQKMATPLEGNSDLDSIMSSLEIVLENIPARHELQPKSYLEAEFRGYPVVDGSEVTAEQILEMSVEDFIRINKNQVRGYDSFVPKYVRQAAYLLKENQAVPGKGFNMKDILSIGHDDALGMRTIGEKGVNSFFIFMIQNYGITPGE